MFPSLGMIVMMVICAVSATAFVLWPRPGEQDMEFWTFARVHEETYSGMIDRWNRNALETDKPTVRMSVVDGNAMIRRTLSAFWAGTPVADVYEVERDMIGQFFAGPVEDVGFVDMTDRLKDSGVYEKFNAPSLSTWTKEGRIFGIPHDVHPVMLAYRVDIVEEAGIDIESIRTWDEFARVMQPLVQDLDGDGTADRYPLNIWYTNNQLIETLLLQAGGGMFDAEENCLLSSDANARVLSTLIAWCFGPQRIAIDAPEFSPSGNQLRLDGRVVCTIMPDWLAGVYKQDLPQLSGKLRLMPLPAWEPGATRTSVMGGTMLAVTASSEHLDAAWEFAQDLYLSRELAERIFTVNTMISPVRDLWEEDFYKEPDPFFGGQVVGLAYIELAPEVPARTSSQFRMIALTRMGLAINSLKRYAESNNEYNVDRLFPVARRLLREQQDGLMQEMNRNVFLRDREQ